MFTTERIEFASLVERNVCIAGSCGEAKSVQWHVRDKAESQRSRAKSSKRQKSNDASDDTHFVDLRPTLAPEHKLSGGSTETFALLGRTKSTL